MDAVNTRYPPRFSVASIMHLPFLLGREAPSVSRSVGRSRISRPRLLSVSLNTRTDEVTVLGCDTKDATFYSYSYSFHPWKTNDEILFPYVGCVDSSRNMGSLDTEGDVRKMSDFSILIDGMVRIVYCHGRG